MASCETQYCLNNTRKGRKFCHKCITRKYRAKNVLRNVYNNLRCNARRRGIYFGLLFSEWVLFCDDTGYICLRGTGSLDMTVDRIDPRVGYVYSNIQMLTNAANLKKRNTDGMKGWATRIESSPDCPF